MKKTLSSVFLILSTLISFAQSDVAKVNWVTFEEALKIQKKEGKKARPIFVDVFTEWCGPCKLLDKTTFQDADVIKKLNEEYIPVKFNGEGQEVITYKGTKFTNPGFDPNKKGRNAVHEFTKHIELVGYPSLFVFDKNGEKAKVIVGYRTGADLIKELTETPKSATSTSDAKKV